MQSGTGNTVLFGARHPPNFWKSYDSIGVAYPFQARVFALRNEGESKPLPIHKPQHLVKKCFGHVRADGIVHSVECLCAAWEILRLPGNLRKLWENIVLSSLEGRYQGKKRCGPLRRAQESKWNIMGNISETMVSVCQGRWNTVHSAASKKKARQ